MNYQQYIQLTGVLIHKYYVDEGSKYIFFKLYPSTRDGKILNNTVITRKYYFDEKRIKIHEELNSTDKILKVEYIINKFARNTKIYTTNAKISRKGQVMRFIPINRRIIIKINYKI